MLIPGHSWLQSRPCLPVKKGIAELASILTHNIAVAAGQGKGSPELAFESEMHRYDPPGPRLRSSLI
jgi:hypothetical protein